jgi:hypothetical protein
MLSQDGGERSQGGYARSDAAEATREGGYKPGLFSQVYFFFFGVEPRPSVVKEARDCGRFLACLALAMGLVFAAVGGFPEPLGTYAGLGFDFCGLGCQRCAEPSAFWVVVLVLTAT